MGGGGGGVGGGVGGGGGGLVDKWYLVQDFNAWFCPPPFISSSPPFIQNMHFCPPLNKILNTALVTVVIIIIILMVHKYSIFNCVSYNTICGFIKSSAQIYVHRVFINKLYNHSR